MMRSPEAEARARERELQYQEFEQQKQDWVREHDDPMLRLCSIVAAQGRRIEALEAELRNLKDSARSAGERW